MLQAGHAQPVCCKLDRRVGKSHGQQRNSVPTGQRKSEKYSLNVHLCDMDGPHGKAPLWSQIFQHWVHPLFVLGFERPLQEEDMEHWPLDSRDDPALHSEIFEGSANVSVRQGILSVLGCRYIFVGMWKLSYLCAILGQPMVLHALLEHLDGRGELEAP